MSDYDDGNMPPPEAMGDDRPSDNEDQLNDVSPEFDDPDPATAAPDDDDDDESLLSEVDEAQFADFDPSAVQVAPDYDSLKTIKVTKRQRVEGEGASKAKEGRREKVRKNKRRHADSDDGFSGGEEIEGKRPRKSKSGAPSERRKPERVEIDESTLTPEERRRRALDRAMDAAIKKSSVRRIKKGDIVSLRPRSVYQVLTIIGSGGHGGHRNPRDAR